MSYKLSDEVLAAIAQSLQLAMLTGTDVVDHLRLIEVTQSEIEPGLAVLSKESKDRLSKNIEDLLDRAKQLSSTVC